MSSKSMTLPEFVEWYVDNRVGKELDSMSEWQARIYQMISEANVHTHLYGCHIIIMKPTSNRAHWICASGAKCPGLRPSDTRFGVIQPKPEQIRKLVDNDSRLEKDS